jgi:hypothetical protein
MVALWIAVGISATGAALTIMGALSGSLPMALIGIASAIAPMAAWVLWGLMLWLLYRSGKRT